MLLQKEFINWHILHNPRILLKGLRLLCRARSLSSKLALLYKLYGQQFPLYGIKLTHFINANISTLGLHELYKLASANTRVNSYFISLSIQDDHYVHDMY